VTRYGGRGGATAGRLNEGGRLMTAVHHPAGTCRIGIGAEAVVDPSLRVQGIERLRMAVRP